MGRRVRRISDGWRYSTQAQDNSFADAYHLTKTGAARGFASVSFDDSSWTRVAVPYDVAVTGELDLDLNNYGGFLYRPNTCFRRYFRLEEESAENRICLRFDGVTGKSDVYVNGVLAVRSESGYNGIELDITDLARFGGALNVIAVISDNTLPEGWWYEGAGIFRDAWLIESGSVGIEDDTVRVVSNKTERETWDISVEAQLYNALGGSMQTILKAELYDGEQCIAETQAELALAERERRGERLTMTVRAPRLWDVGHGELYEIRLSAIVDGVISDNISVAHGFRTIAFDADKGFFINGRNVKMKGLCYHEDEGNLGVAVDRGVFRRRLENLIAMGGNAYRCAHNTPHPELLKLCDQMGVLVMDETRMFASTSIACAELEKMVRRDRNHPCIVLWSVGNEEPWQADERGERMTRTMKALVDSLDGTRPVTMAMHSGHLNRHSAAVSTDVVGLNYNIEDYDALRAMYPDKPMLATEVFCLADENVEGDLDCAAEAIKTLRYVNERPFISGLFSWAGQDYRGEHRYLSFFTDACPIASNGERKDGFYRFAAAWKEQPLVHICGHWNHRIGQEIPVSVYGNAEIIELWLNGQKLGEAAPGDAYKVTFSVVYEPGELRAIGRSNGNAVAEDNMQTVGTPERIRLTAKPMQAGEYLVVEAEAVDAQDRRHPMGSHLVQLSADQGRIICADNADPYFHRGAGDDDTMFYHGRARAVIDVRGAKGSIRVTAQSPTLQGDEITVQAEQSDTETLPEQNNPYINDWFVSRVWDEKPDIHDYTPDNQYIRAQKYFEPWRERADKNPFYFRKGYMVYCTEPNLPDITPGRTPAIVFEKLAAGAEVLISIRDYNNEVLRQYESRMENRGALRVPLNGAESGDRLIIKVLMDSSKQSEDLIGLPVRFEV